MNTLKKINQLQDLLQKKGINTIIINSYSDLKEFVNNSVPNDRLVGLGNSISSGASKIRDIIHEKGNKIFYSWNGSTDYNRDMDTFEEKPIPEYYLTVAEKVMDNGVVVDEDYSPKAVSENTFPKNIIAFLGIDGLKGNLDTQIDNLKQTVLGKTTNITIAFTAFEI